MDRLASAYPEAYAFSSPKQLEWMVAQGFPMPEEYLRAQSLPREDLMTMAKSGNVKAAMLAYDQVLSELAEADALFDGTETTSPKALAAMEFAMNRNHCSPFPFYLTARYHEQTSRLISGPSAQGALMMVLSANSVIGSLGDRRVSNNSKSIAEGLELSPARISEMAESAARLRGRTSGNCNPLPMPRS